MVSTGSVIIFYLHIFLSKAFAACYWPNGIDVNKQLKLSDYRPCDDGDEESMCCALNRAVADKCRSDGLCEGSRWPDTGIWRDSCTDPTWKSPKCLKLCTQGLWRYTNISDTADMHNMDVTITPCGDGSYCCGNGTFAQPCCDQKEGVFMVNGDAIPYTQFKAVSTILESLITPPSSITTRSLTTSPPVISSSPGPSTESASLDSSSRSLTTSPPVISLSRGPSTESASLAPSSRSLTTSPPVTSSSSGPSAESASLAPSSRVITAIVSGTCAFLLLLGALAFTLRKFRRIKPLKSQISKPRILNLPEVYGDNGSNELDGFREFELDRPGNFPEML